MKLLISNVLLLYGLLLSGQSPLQYVNPLIGTAPATTQSAIIHGAGTEEKAVCDGEVCGSTGDACSIRAASA